MIEDKFQNNNDWADFWYHLIDVNVIAATTKEKIAYEIWLQWQDKSIPNHIHESCKKNCLYDNGIAVITGEIWRGPNKGQYLVGIDCDNKKAIDEIW